jgi:citrate lyase subunit beta/citryl-CoA lyase
VNPSSDRAGPWRALLFVPADSGRLIQSAIRRRPEAVILDLEDGVAEGAKAGARTLLREHQAQLAAAGIDVVLRVNAGLPAMVRDLEAADLPGLAAVMVSKCADTRGLLNARELLAGDSGLLALVESPAALPRLDAIAAVPDLIGIMFGPEDYAAELGVPPDSGALDVPATLVAAACAARGLQAIGLAGSIADFSDLEAYRARVLRARGLGFTGAAAIHPAQLPILASGFAPGEAELDRARRIVAAFDLAAAENRGVVALDGAMLDAPVVERARRLLRQAGETGN